MEAIPQILAVLIIMLTRYPQKACNLQRTFQQQNSTVIVSRNKNKGKNPT